MKILASYLKMKSIEVVKAGKGTWGFLSPTLLLSLFHCSLGWSIRDISLIQKEKQNVFTPILLKQATSRLADTFQEP